MTSIQILPSALADKIAAGEVVERPASVVKELIENACDAGATHIRVDIRNAGRSLIQVRDNGCGMTREELALSVKRHATSKIREEADLFAIRTLGFRGEALPSIGAVSRLTLQSRKGNEDEGGYLRVEGGNVLEERVDAPGKGTLVKAEDLFFNTPARLKFLKSDGVERGHIESALIQFALGRPDCAVEYFAEGKEKLSAVVARDPLQRLHDCLGKTFAEDAIYLEEKHPEISLRGWVVHPRQSAGNANGIYFYLNGRALKDRLLQHALMSGFGDFLMKGRFGKGVLYLEMSPSEVDVNVHPSKREVRFRQPQIVHQFVAKAVKKGLESKLYTTAGKDAALKEAFTLPQPSVEEGVAEAIKRFYTQPPKKEYIPPFVRTAESRQAATAPAAKIPFGELRVIGSFLQTYILCEGPGEKLYMIDQHAAHEWIGFAKLKEQFSERKGRGQRLLVPVTWEGTPKQRGVLEENLEALNAAGLETELFGGNTFIVKSVPELIREKQIPALLEKLAETLEETGTGGVLEKAKEHVLKTVACHSQVRAKDKLVWEEMSNLLKEMDQYNALHCPHGRPTTVEVTRAQIEGWFKRI